MTSRWLASIACALTIGGCKSAPMTPLETVPQVDLQRFMGNWYVIANIPPFIEKGAHNSIESYRLDPDGTIDTRFTYRADSFDGKFRTLNSRGFVQDSRSNAVWGVQFIWPIKADYRIVHLAPDYSQTIVAREKRDYLWIMARTPEISRADYERLVSFAGLQGYDVNLIQKVPQKWN